MVRKTESDRRIGQRYDRLAEKYDQSRFGGPFGEFYADNMLSLIDWLLPATLEPCKVLDVAAGTGIAALHLAKKGHGVTAIDISELMVRLGQAKARSGSLPVSFVVGNARSLPYPDEHFDLLVSVMFLYLGWSHEDRVVFMNEMRRVLKPGGLLVLEVLNPLWGPLVEWYQQFLEERRHTKSTRRQTAELIAGFRILGTGACNYPKLGWVHRVSVRFAWFLARMGRYPPLRWFGLERYLLLQKL
jgi:ubiquinone/menaquinone biosynthesis C-methylase UbiE